MSEHSSFPASVARLAVGDQNTATELFNQSIHRLLGLARRRLYEVTRRGVDPDDVVQSAWLSFMTRRVAPTDFPNQDGLWEELLAITLRQCGTWNKRFQRHPSGEVPLAEVVADDPTPEESVTLADLVEHLMRGLTDRQRQVLTLRLQGYNVLEICRQAQLSERTVFRTLEEVRGRTRERLEPLLAH